MAEAETPEVPETPETPEAPEIVAEVPDDLEKWKAHSRKHESRSKSEKERADVLQAKLDQIERAGQSEQEQAVANARDEAKAEAKAEADAERRADRLEVQVTRIASRGVTIGDKTVKFADTDDALLRIERAIKSGDISADNIFDSEGKVQTDALTTALEDILKAAPHLRAGDPAPAPKGSADAGAGAGAPSLGDEIREAMEQGDVAKAISLKNQQLLALDRP